VTARPVLLLASPRLEFTISSASLHSQSLIYDSTAQLLSTTNRLIDAVFQKSTTRPHPTNFLFSCPVDISSFLGAATYLRATSLSYLSSLSFILSFLDCWLVTSRVLGTSILWADRLITTCSADSVVEDFHFGLLPSTSSANPGFPAPSTPTACARGSAIRRDHALDVRPAQRQLAVSEPADPCSNAAVNLPSLLLLLQEK